MNTACQTTPPGSTCGPSVKPANTGIQPISRLARKLPWAFWVLIMGQTGLLWWDSVQGWSTLTFIGDNLLNILPFLLGSALLAGYLEAAGADQLIGRVFQHRVGVAIVLASIMGAFSPFCSCGVIPLIAALLVSGVPLSAIMAFWMSSPVMDPAQFVVTSGGIGLGFAVIKSVAAMGLGLFAGTATHWVMLWGGFQSPSRVTQLSGCAARPRQYQAPVWSVWQDTARLATLYKKAGNMVTFLLQWLLLAYFLESLMLTYVSAESLGQWLAPDSSWTLVVAALVGVPAYLNGFAAVPLVASLMDNGLSQGAALTFMLAGSITSIPAAIAVFSLVRVPIFAWYLFLALSGSILAGLAVNLLSAMPWG